jgi:hypothetical protein
MLGICCVTYPESVRNKSVLDGKIGMYEIYNPFSAITIRNDLDNISVNSIKQLWKLYDEKTI